MKKTLLFFFATVLSFAQTVSLDTTFGNGGKVISTNSGSFISSALQSNGKILVLSLTVYNTNGNLHIRRYNTDGTIDTSFGNNGILDSQLYAEGDFNHLKVLPDDSILIVGTYSNSLFGIQKLTSNGTTDLTFGNNGYAIINDTNSNIGYDIAIQNDGKLIISGEIYAGSFDFGVIRLLANGTLDTSFGNNGVTSVNIGSTYVSGSSGNSSDYLFSLTLDSNENIYLAGVTNTNKTADNQEDFVIAKLTSNGILDNSFATNGIFIYDFGSKDYLYDIKCTTDSKLIAIGTSNGSGFAKMAGIKIDSNGNLDTTFATNGILFINKDNSTVFDGLRDCFLLNDNSFLVSGATINSSTPSNADLLIVKFDNLGQIDTNFNSTGFKTLDFDGRNDYGYSVLFQNNKILTTGLIYGSDGAMARFELSTMATQNNNLTNVSVYPNPFQDNFTIKTNDITTIKDVALYDILGKSITINPVLNNENITINTENIQNGIYFLKYNQSGKTTTHKLIKTE